MHKPRKDKGIAMAGRISHRSSMRRQWRTTWMAAGTILLASCGGGGGGGAGIGAPPPGPAPTPTPTTPVSPPPPPPAITAFEQVAVPSQFNTREFRNSDGPAQHNAHAAWQDGFTGQDVTVAVIDTGIDVDSPEFAGRLSDKSTDIYASRNELQGPDDHGTNVAMVAAAARDDTGVMGIAWNATVLAIRSDEPGSCGGDNAADSTTECGFTDQAIADSIRYAVANEAKVVNISLGGPGGVTATLAMRSATQ